MRRPILHPSAPFTPICVPPILLPCLPRAGAASLPCLPGAAKHCPGNSPQGIMKAAQLKWPEEQTQAMFPSTFQGGKRAGRAIPALSALGQCATAVVMGISAPSQTLGSATSSLRNSQSDNNLFQGLYDIIPSFFPSLLSHLQCAHSVLSPKGLFYPQMVQ